MDRRKFLAGLGLCAALAAPLGCAPKNEPPSEEEDDSISKEDMEKGMGQHESDAETKGVE